MQLSSLEIVAYSDASFGNVKNGGSQGGYVVFITDAKNKACPLCWSSKRLKRVVRSTLAAEALALLEALDSAIFIRQFLSEILHQDAKSAFIPIKCFIDNNDLFVALSSSKNVAEKRLRAEIHFLQDTKNNENVQFKWVATREQLADVLTKTGALPGNLLDALENGRVPLT